MSAATKDERRAKLHLTWELMASAVLRALQASEPSASAMEVARKWLDANGVTLDSIRSWGHVLGFDPANLPVFNDTDDADDSDQDGQRHSDRAALSKVPGFAPADDD